MESRVGAQDIELLGGKIKESDFYSNGQFKKDS
jgi:hypothetical protein